MSPFLYQIIFSSRALTLVVAITALTAGALPAAAQALTGPQKNAVRSAQNYLSFKGFSRNGLIEQLSSQFGDRYAVADATAAVDSLSVDWNEQAARSASQYLQIMGFSCQGLIEQLASPHGEKFTVQQATHGARAAGAC